VRFSFEDFAKDDINVNVVEDIPIAAIVS